MGSDCKVVFICGECGAGKSTLVRTFGTMGYPAFHSSAVFSKMREKMTEGCDMESPEFADNMIHDAMWRFMDKHRGEGTLFVEAVPRSIGQLAWVEEAVKVFGAGNVYAVWLFAPASVRIGRMSERRPGRSEFDARRMASEDHAKHYGILSGLHSVLGEMHVMTFNTGRVQVEQLVDAVSAASSSPLLSDSISGMMTSAVNGYEERDGYCSQNARFDRMLMRVRGELDELEESRRDGKGEQDEREEFADVMHFMFCLADSIGIRPCEIYDVFRRKNMINESRLQFPDVDKHSLNGRLVGDVTNDG